MHLLKNRSTVFLLLIVLFSTFLFSYKLATIPSNVTGDESTYLGMNYRILYGNSFINPFERMEDTKPALGFYWMAMWIKLFGTENTVFAMRFSVVVLSILTLVMFYILLKKHTNDFISLLFTLLLSTSIWFLNFARSSWLNTGSLLLGLLLIYILDTAIKKNTHKWFFYAGFIAAANCYGYLSGYLFPLSSIVFFLWYIFKSKHKKHALISSTLYFVTFFIFLIPLFIMITSDTRFFLLRPQVVYIFNNIPQEKMNDMIYLTQVYFSQCIEVVKGLFFMIPSPIGKGIENPRYFPINTSVIDPFITLLFWGGTLYILFWKKKINSMWIAVYVLTILTVGALTVDAPNIARTITALPTIYFFAAIFFYKIISFLQKKYPRIVIYGIVIIIALITSYLNTTHYFNWITSPQSASARQPAIEYSEFSDWQDFQINRVKQGLHPITNYEWYQIRETLYK